MASYYQRSKLRTGMLVASVLAVSLVGCSSGNKPKGPIIEYYHPAYRQFPPEPVYSRVTWSLLPQPLKPKVRENAPLIMPVIAFEMPKSTLGSSIQALAQAIGYNWYYPPEAADRPVAIKMTGEVDEILREIGRQAAMQPVLDHEARVVRVLNTDVVQPERPEAVLPNAGRENSGE